MPTKRHPDPTRTIGVTKRWIAQSNKRFRALKKAIRRQLTEPNPEDTFLANAFEYENNPQAITDFMDWLQGQIDDQMLTGTASDNWQNQFIEQSYDKGFARAQVDMRKAGIIPKARPGAVPPPIVGTAVPSIAVTVGGGAELLGTAAAPLHRAAIQTLYIREFQSLKGVTDEMSKQIARALVEGVEQGLNAREIAANVVDRVDSIGSSRAKTIARTETSRAYNSAVIAEGETVSRALDVDVLYAWITAGDDRVREKHEDWGEGGPYTAEEAQRMIGEPNCRCALRIVPDEESEKRAA